MFIPILVLCGACASDPPRRVVDHRAEEQQIRQLTLDLYDAENRRDLNAIMGFMADGFVAQIPGTPPLIRGKEGVRAATEAFLGSLVSVADGPMTIVVSDNGDMAYQFGRSKVIVQGPDGQVEDPQKHLFVWRKINGQWKVVAGAYSSDVSM
ncbi:MAG: DUF4440 domain-containing protein [Candidatus Latescibacteria bacterium]|nr:DUF4440 domain-containing protein [Candidatus Latescibacterota bacterium]